jgi:hypothetical protein
MRLVRVLIPWIFTCGFLAADELSQADRLALLEKIDKLQSNGDERLRAASAAFRGGMSSDEAVVEFYIKCVGKTDFEDAAKKPQEFKDWKRKNAQRLQDARFRAALRHQLAWLVLTLQQASTHGKKDDLPAKVNEEIESLFRDPRLVTVERATLEQPVLNTVFARTYKLDSVKVPDWPPCPIYLGQIYDSVILPPLRKPDEIEDLRAAWHRRILHESQLAGRDLNAPPAAKDPFFSYFLPELVWSMEEDLYHNGDQRGAVLRMYQHIEKNQANPKAREWSQRLLNLLSPPQDKPKDGEKPKDASAPQ